MTSIDLQPNVVFRVKTGALQGSGTPGRSATDIAAEHPAEFEEGKLRKEIGFNTDYAAAVHENLEAHHDVGQAKFLEAAMNENQSKMAPFVAEAVKAAGE